MTRCTVIGRGDFSTGTATATGFCRCTGSAASSCWSPTFVVRTSMRPSMPGRYCRCWSNGCARHGREFVSCFGATRGSAGTGRLDAGRLRFDYGFSTLSGIRTTARGGTVPRQSVLRITMRTVDALNVDAFESISRSEMLVYRSCLPNSEKTRSQTRSADALS